MMEKTKIRVALAAFVLGLSFVVSVSAAEEDHTHDDHAHRFFAGAKGTFLASFVDGETHLFGGGGLFFEVALGPVELELCARVLGNGHGVILPVDLLLKLPFHLTQTIHPFVGLGPTLVPVFLEENALHVGLATAIGSYFWISNAWALALEVNYNLVFEGHLAHEVMANVGVVFGW
ncbi:MAG: hypothetical protein QNJ97_07745 [Myxococcota bacterium]|nr:hypothetical protein [Myxococcota bacterium]